MGSSHRPTGENGRPHGTPTLVGPGYLTGREPPKTPENAPLQLREPGSHLEAWMGPALGQQTPHFWGKPTARLPLPLCPVLCSLKIQSVLLVVPSSTPASERGRGRRGVTRNPDCSKKLHYRRPSSAGAPHCLRWLQGESSSWSRWPPGVRMRESLPPAPQTL